MTEVLAVIDAATGTILDPSNLHVVVVSEEELDAVDGDDSATHDLAMKKGAHITQELLESLPHGVAAVCRALGCQVETDNDGQYVAYTDEYDPGHVERTEYSLHYGTRRVMHVEALDTLQNDEKVKHAQQLLDADDCEEEEIGRIVDDCRSFLLDVS